MAARRYWQASGNDNARLAPSLQTLADVFGLSVTDLRALLASWHAHDGQAEPFARGAHSLLVAARAPLRLAAMRFRA